MDDAPTVAPRLTSAEMLARLVGFDTTSRNSNLDLIDFVRDYLDAHGVPYRLSYDPTGAKANIHAVVGPAVPGGVALSGHVDTVPVDGQAWTGDPFTLRAEGGRLIGRGAADMKGFVAASLAAVPDLLALKLARPAHLFITYDEETDTSGARRLIADLKEAPLRPALCVVGEPTSMRPVVAHKGRTAVTIRVRGKPGHSSQPARGVNAVHAAAEAVAWIAAEARRHAAEGPFEDGFDPPHTTIQVGTIAGGTILNIIPEACSFDMEYRTIPADDPLVLIDRLRAHVATVIEPAMRAVDPACGFSIDVRDDLPALSLDTAHPLFATVAHLTDSNTAGKVSYGTEGGLYQRADVPTIVCGPGDIAQAHQPDEWIAQSDLDACDRFIRRLADRLLV